MIATSATTRVGRTGPSWRSSWPSATTSRQVRESVPTCGTIALWNFSAPAWAARHWKNITPSEPRAIAWWLHSRITPGGFTRFCGRQLTWLVACSISSQGLPWPSDRQRS